MLMIFQKPYVVPQFQNDQSITISKKYFIIETINRSVILKHDIL